LGEAYTKTARLAAAEKALERARELNPSDWKCFYFLGNVHRQSGQYQHAIDTFTSILLEVPSELTVIIALAQTHLEYGRAELSSGFSARAESSFLTSISVVLNGLDASPGFRRIAWKTAADALCELSRLSVYSDEELLISVLKKTVPFVTASPLGQLSSFLTVPPVLAENTFPSLSLFALEISVCACNYRISLGSLDKAASASAWYDLGVAVSLLANRSIDNAKREHINDEAVRCIKESITLSPFDDRYWSALASALFTSKPRLAQHAYVKALELDTKVGFLCLRK
jgi:superkiller protein 3